MKTISWHWLANGKFKSIFLTMAMVVFWTACSDDTSNLRGPGVNDASAGIKANINSTSSFNDYTIVVTSSTDGTEWTYTISKKAVAITTGKTPKDLSHFIINLQNCGDESATFSDILYATVNGQPANFVNSEGSGTGCNPQDITTNFVKIDDMPSASSWVIVIKFDRGYQKVTTKGWIKAGSSCNIGDIQGPGCPITDQCSYGQGRFFANGFDTNGSVAQWPLDGNNNPILTIGGKNYSPTETHALWAVNTGQGMSEVMKAFFQLGALILSDVAPAELADEMTTIENYFSGIPKVTVSTCTKQNGPNTVTYNCIILPDTSNGVSAATVRAAAGVIGEWISANECPTIN